MILFSLVVIALIVAMGSRVYTQGRQKIMAGINTRRREIGLVNEKYRYI
jgi:hypothetical protein